MNERILVIDYDPDILKDLESLLTKAGYRVRSACGNEEAIRIFKSEPIDLVITELRMPELNGVELTHQLKSLDEHVEIVVLTGATTIDNVIHAMRNNGAFDFLPKPLRDLDQLIFTVKEALDKRRLKKENMALIEGIKKSKKNLEYRIQELSNELNELKKRSAPETLNKEV